MKAGTIFLVTTGEYSDFGIYAALRAKVDFDFDACLAEWIAAHPENDRDYGFRDDRFMSDLVLSGNVEEITIPKLHLSNYSTPEKTPEKDAHPKVSDALQWGRACFAHEDCRAHPELGAACATRPISNASKGSNG